MKKYFFRVSAFFTAALLIANYFGNYAICDHVAQNGYIGTCPEFLFNIEIVSFPILPLFIFSLLTYRLPERYFRAWSRFALVWIPLSMLAIACSPEYGDSIMPIYSITKGVVAYYSSILFALISAIILLFVWFRSVLRK